MSEALVFLGPALVMCLVIASLHVWLGMHVLAREIIFVDLSLAQLAALGATVGVLLVEGDAHHGEEQVWMTRGAALLATAAGAALFALTRRARVSQEAVVGIVYAVASAAMVLLLSRAPHGAERIKDVLVGALLLTSWQHVAETAVIYLVLGALQLALARRFVRLSWRQASASPQPGEAWWDFVFYLLFGLVIVVSVQVAGVLLVFSFLIVPAVITRLFSDRLLPRLLWGQVVAALASVLGLAMSWAWDLPTGAAVVVAFGALLALAAGLARRVDRGANGIAQVPVDLRPPFFAQAVSGEDAVDLGAAHRR